MKILILGAGVTGSSVAEALASEENDIVVVDFRTELLDALKERFDIATVAGNAAHPSVLEQAGAQTADMIIAVTDRDETNMLACVIINALYSRPKTIARVRAIDYLKNPLLFSPNGIPVDIVISPEQIVMESIRNLIEFPGVMHISDFAGGLVRLFSVKVVADGSLTGKKIKTLKKRLVGGKIRVVAIFRQGVPLTVNGEAVIETGDEVFFVSPREEVRRVLKELNKLEAPLKRIIIAGGGHVGKRLALALEKDHQVKIIEKDPRRARKIANDLDHSVVLLGDCADESLLIDEAIESTDLFCAITENDGVNIISASLAKSLGARKAICLLNHISYTKLLPNTGIDVAVLPNQETLGSILKHVRRGDVAQVKSLCGGTAEAIEAVAHHTEGENSVVGRRVDSINFPEGIVMGALIRNSQVISIHHETLFEDGDHVVMFAMDKKLVVNIEKKFQPL
ncbi:MAG: Trk system potassium transporter TrkA [Methylococcaceae bacterium]|nr:Trk system potassium transporter TrkA [Methylococcaceae bacterium]MDP3020319.1 Trk system potassium transporter TrkA [Methylococcaceae bacterium]MDP3391926.1 Trk system potassium transporter TrkA [Methylococcaceae bacterium]MDP3932681.1 Trk system potassium transporter TrkA [Methylococcaceae bacterium]MDZ4158000.1 Trk system potassium transporter TrkA [Methylococcales bacterium]